MNQPKQLPELGAGDLVIMNRIHSLPHIAKITRVTATQILVGELRFRRRGGHTTGEHYYGSPWISAPESEEQIEQIRLAAKQARYAKHLKDTDWNKIKLPVLESVVELISKAADAAKGGL